jgi:uncharacterized membrane protein
MTQSTNRQSRLAYIDWMRGLACVLMFQTHCYDSWLSPAARESTFFKWSQLGGTFPAPLFLFLAGISFALVTDKMRQRGIAANQIARTTILRGAEIFGLGLLFRVQEFLLGQPWPGALFGQIGAPHGAPWTDLLRVDILNTIGLSMMLLGAVCRLTATRGGSIVMACATSLLIAMVTPPLWTTWRPRFLPWPLESYINGVHTFREPQPWLFPIFPWTAFAFAGLAAGFVVFGDWARRHEAWAVSALGGGGVALTGLAHWFDSLPVQLYAVYDFWHTSPSFFLIRLGLLLIILLLCYAWCRWGPGEWGFSPIIQLGQTSLLVYWVHISFVYGRFSILGKGQQSVATASLGLLAIFVAMVILSLVRTRTKGKGAAILARFCAGRQRSPQSAQRTQS